MPRELDAFIRDFSKELAAGNAAIFAGAGLSAPAGYVNWKKLLKNLIEDLGLDADTETDLVSIAQFHVNKQLQNRSKINQIIINEFSHNAAITENHKILARLPISTYWTTNYDKLIERALEQSGKIPDVKYTVPQLAVTRPKRDAVIYKMHGDVEHADEAILIKDDYEKYHITRGAFAENLSGDLVSKTFLFIGFSFSDPNIDYVLGRIRSRYQKNMREHYCFIKKINRHECKSDADFEYKKTKQGYFVSDLKRFNINAIMIDSHEQITDVLYTLERIYKSKTVLISGSAAEYGPWGRDKAEDFIQLLAAKLTEYGFRIVSGFGLGVGSAVITGALKHIYFEKGQGSSEGHLILRPFPQKSSSMPNTDQLWKKYREEMASYAGIGIFIFGNKIDDNGNVFLADGVRKEFDIAKNKGMFLIPVGATGYIAQDLWEEVKRDMNCGFGEFSKDVLQDFLTIGDSSNEPKTVIDSIMKILNVLTK